eukprot:15354-Heterococcus_DN1.PRE.2
MVAFLAHVDARNAGAVVFSTLERGAAVVKQIMLEQLQSAETDAHILKASQQCKHSPVQLISAQFKDVYSVIKQRLLHSHLLLFRNTHSTDTTATTIAATAVYLRYR